MPLPVVLVKGTVLLRLVRLKRWLGCARLALLVPLVAVGEVFGIGTSLGGPFGTLAGSGVVGFVLRAGSSSSTSMASASPFTVGAGAGAGAGADADAGSDADAGAGACGWSPLTVAWASSSSVATLACWGTGRALTGGRVCLRGLRWRWLAAGGC